MYLCDMAARCDNNTLWNTFSSSKSKIHFDIGKTHTQNLNKQTLSAIRFL